MLTRVDRVQVAVADLEEAARGWVEVLGAEPAGDDPVAALAARRARLRLGNGWVELLAPDGAGPVADSLAERGRPHLFGGGVATPDVAALRDRLEGKGVAVAVEGGQLFLSPEVLGGHGLRLVVSEAADLPPVGLVDQFYEVTNLVHDHAGAMAHYADLFGLDTGAFSPISSDEYGYEGVLTLFDPDRLDRLEVITPTDEGKTMGRFFAKAGESLYMCFAETGALPEIEERAKAAAAPHTSAPGTLFLHPDALGGMMLGLSHRSVAWVWSGRPDRVEAP
jgi:hypothetical protein